MSKQKKPLPPAGWKQNEILAPKVDRRARLNANTWVEADRWVKVSSSWVREIRYDKDKHQLFVTFKDGATCRYSDIPIRLAKQFFNAPSMGRWVWKHLYHMKYDLV